MVKDRNTTAVTSVGPAAPEFLVQLDGIAEDRSLDAMKQFRRVPRLYVVQKQSPDALLNDERLGRGAVFIPGQGDEPAIPIAKQGEIIEILPVFFFVEYVGWNDRDDKSSGMFSARSFDPQSEIGRKCRNKASWTEPYTVGDKSFKRRNCETLNFACLLRGRNDQPEPVIVAYSRGTFREGSAWIAGITGRKIGGTLNEATGLMEGGNIAPIWTQAWGLTSTLRSNDEYTWNTLEAGPIGNPWVTADEASVTRTLYESLQKDYDEKALIVDHAIDESGTAGSKRTVDVANAPY